MKAKMPKVAPISMSVWLDENNRWQWSVHKELAVVKKGSAQTALSASMMATTALIEVKSW